MQAVFRLIKLLIYVTLFVKQVIQKQNILMILSESVLHWKDAILVDYMIIENLEMMI